MSYNRVIRNVTTGFSDLFSNITLVRYNPDDTEQERFIVPIAHAAKELYVMRLQSDPDADKKIQITLPRMSFEMTGISYDHARKQNTNTRNFNLVGPGTINAQYNPVPYDIDYSLYIYVRNIEDGTQIIEHILPFFTPDYTIKINLIPEMDITKEIPIILTDTNYEITYEGDSSSDTRMVIWTLNFKAKAFLYRDVTTAGLIKHAITNIIDEDTNKELVQINVIPSPLNANVNSNWTANTTIKEYN